MKIALSPDAAADLIAALEEALNLIAGMQGLTLLDSSLGADGDRAHQIGANKAFNQCADIARAALAKAKVSA